MSYSNREEEYDASGELENEDEENNSQERAMEFPTFSQSYHPSSHTFPVTAFELRKNLTETFNQHVHPTKESSSSSSGSRMTASGRVVQPSARAAQRVFSVSDKIAHYEQQQSSSAAGAKPTETTNNNNTFGGKPPRQPLKPSSSSLNLKTKKKTGTASLADDNHCVSVYLRVRPPKEGLVNTIEVLPGDPATKVRTHAPERSNVAKINRDPQPCNSNNGLPSEPPTVVREFEFQKVFGPDHKQEGIYEDIVAPMVSRMFPSLQERDHESPPKEPESGLLFAYGATNAGKTYSILGQLPSNNNNIDKREPILKQEQQWGMIPRAFQDILGSIERCNEQDPSQEIYYDLYLSYYEIYNENIYDLLAETPTSQPIFMREPLKLRESRKQTFIRGLVRKKVTSVAEGLKLARLANGKRHTSSNNLNDNSSRSHSICQMQVLRRPAQHSVTETQASLSSSSTTATANGYNTDEEASQISKEKPTTLWIVDLAGSERSKRTNVGFLRQKEASLINKSLMNLMRCLTMMRENQSAGSSNQVIPFRENKLTHLFMPVFTGRSAARVSMIVNVNPEAPEFDETNHVLSYASKAKMVQIDQTQKITAIPAANTGTEYGYDGRPAASKAQRAASKIKSLVKKLSPKKFMNTSKGTRKRVATEALDKKGLPAPPARVPSFTTASTTRTSSQNDSQPQQAKRMRLVKTNSSNSSKNLFQQNSASAVNNYTESNEIKSLKMALSIAQAEIEVLRSEKDSLADQVAEIESQVRIEVSEEMEVQINNTKRHYQNVIDGMKRQMRLSLSITEKRDRMDKASEQIDVLLFKIEECEEEMERMREHHQDEMTEVTKSSDEKDAANQREIMRLQHELAKYQKLDGKNSTRDTDAASGAIIGDEKDRTIQMQQEEIERLKNSKLELIHNYEQLLNQDNEESDMEEAEEDEEEDGADSAVDEDECAQCSNNSAILSKKDAPRYMTRTHSNQSLQKRNRAKGSRAPLSSISGNFTAQL